MECSNDKQLEGQIRLRVSHGHSDRATSLTDCTFYTRNSNPGPPRTKAEPTNIAKVLPHRKKIIEKFTKNKEDFDVLDSDVEKGGEGENEEEGENAEKGTRSRGKSD
ncbi:UNVERIFIED_CONTAM: hypothetical protein Sindi_1236900 [Sesamum indicum]